MNPFDLTGKTALVTGAARGIGKEIARVLAGAGAEVIIAEYNVSGAEETAAELRDQGCRIHTVEVDVRDSASVAAMTETAYTQVAHLDILVNNAGIAANTPAEAISDDEWLNVMNVNLNGLYWCCREVGRRMLARGSGSIVNIASMSGLVVNHPQPQAHYNASKAAVIMLTKSLAAEWATRGVRVNAVSPGYIGTDLVKGVLERNQSWRDTWLAMTPTGRLGEPSDVAHAVWYLASDAAKYATGTNLVVDGGYTSW
jgi:NAD(P)-dependent dehydrogenase (short-subunit alcohol dehydrogenase family)